MAGILTYIVAAVLTAPFPAFAADVVAWGAIANRLHLGIAFGSASSEPELRVLLTNSGPAAQQILVGSQVGKGTALNFKFIATARDGTKHEGFEINSFTPIAGLVLPAVIDLAPGATHELHLPLKNIICIEKPWDVTFETLVKQGASMHVSLETDEQNAKWAGSSSPWIGRVDSGELVPLK